MLPENTILGTLEYTEVYDFYDTPQFFSCRNEKEDIYLGLAVDNEPLTYLFALIEDSDVLFLAKYGLNTSDFYLTLSYRVFKVVMLEEKDIAVEISQIEVESYFSDYIERRKESQEEFAAFLVEFHETSPSRKKYMEN